jgi:hypothetical protein
MGGSCCPLLPPLCMCTSFILYVDTHATEMHTIRDARGRIHRYYGVELRYVEYGVGRGIDAEM